MASRFRTPEGEETARRIGDRIRDARMARGLSQKQLARALGITHQSVNKYELANVELSIARLLALAKVLGVSPAFLIGDASPARPQASPASRPAAVMPARLRPAGPRPADRKPDKPG
jgi:transcriptional regulator with XRE-family HTH domain